jgi:hypothetical protein
MKATLFPLFGAIATATVAFSAIPAEAISVSRGAGPSFAPTATITFDTPTPASYASFDQDYGSVNVTGANVAIREDDDEPTSPFFRLNASGSQSSATFNLDSSSDSFGFFLVGQNGSPNFRIDFLSGGSNSRTFFLSDLLSLTGPGDYFNFASDSEGDFFDQVSFTRLSGRLEIDSVAFRAVPTPALLPGIIGIGIAALKKRRDGGLEAAEADAEA